MAHGSSQLLLATNTVRISGCTTHNEADEVFTQPTPHWCMHENCKLACNIFFLRFNLKKKKNRQANPPPEPATPTVDPGYIKNHFSSFNMVVLQTRCLECLESFPVGMADVSCRCCGLNLNRKKDKKEKKNKQKNNKNTTTTKHTVDPGCITNHFSSFNMVVLPTGSRSVLPWEWHMRAADFLLQTQFKSLGAPLKTGRMRCSLSPHHNGERKNAS